MKAVNGGWDIVVAPRATFAALRERPQWRRAFLLAALLGALGGLLQVPAREHVAGLLLASDSGSGSALAAMSESRRGEAEAFALGVVRWTWLASPLLLALSTGLGTLVMLLATALARHRAGAAPLFALAANVAVVKFGLGSLALGTIMLLRGSNDFATDRALLTALPSLAWFAPQSSPALATVLEQVDPFAVWSCVLLFLGLSEVAGTPAGAALPAAALVAFGGAVLAPLAR